MRHDIFTVDHAAASQVDGTIGDIAFDALAEHVVAIGDIVIPFKLAQSVVSRSMSQVQPKTAFIWRHHRSAEAAQCVAITLGENGQAADGRGRIEIEGTVGHKGFDFGFGEAVVCCTRPG